ncbi:unnamed protein product [Heligmosomoides polygyrus]|uniref:Uncharacterized protein n=1 Tax=Heligmosomoides polygyrus TaxID=6339 RepID=A0A183G890_HELPZ|nr:unnamed protein product [Heligmosomoides polygyrus]
MVKADESTQRTSVVKDVSTLTDVKSPTTRLGTGPERFGARCGDGPSANSTLNRAGALRAASAAWISCNTFVILYNPTSASNNDIPSEAMQALEDNVSVPQTPVNEDNAARDSQVQAQAPP